MNTDFVLKLIEPYLSDNKLSDKIFEEVFKSLEKSEKYSVIDILIANDIDISYDDEDELTVEQCINNDEKTSNSIYVKPNEVVYEPALNSTCLSNEHLCILFKKGDQRALDLLYKNNEKFIWKLVSKIGKSYNHKLDSEDLYSYGFFGLRKAALKFDPSLEYSFLTYAGYWIKQSMFRAIADFGFTIRVPVHIFDNINYLKRVMRENSFPSEKELIDFICEDKEIDEKRAREWMVISQSILKPISLNTEAGNDKDSELIDFLVNHDESVEKQCEDVLLKDNIQSCIDCLKPRESDVIRMRFGLNGNSFTLEDIGKKYSVTRERIRQIESKALKKLQNMRGIIDLKVYLEG